MLMIKNFQKIAESMNVKHILLVEDDPTTIELVRAVCNDHFQLSVAKSIEESRKAIADSNADLVLLDLTLPDGNGLHLLTEMRNSKEHQDLPVLLFTGQGGVDDQIMGYTLGANDYLVKPLAPKLLRAKLDSKFKEIDGRRQSSEEFKVGSLRFKIPYQQATINEDGLEQPIELSSLQFKLLLHFARHIDQVFSREQLIDRIWGESINVIDRTIDTHVSQLRKKLPSEFQLKSVHGVGYRMVMIEEQKMAA